MVALAIDDEVAFGAVAAAVGRRPELVRLEVVVGDRWLLPLTYVGEPLRPPEPRPGEEVAIVGHRRVIRARGAPRVRVADLRLHPGARVEIFLEHGKPGGREVALLQLEEALRDTQPTVEAMTVHADADVPWRDFVALVRASACFDRAAGDEPHELIWDERRRRE